MLKSLKLASLVPPIVGGIVGQLLDAKFLEKLDPLKGFLGFTPHLFALAVFALAWIWATHLYKLKSKTAVAKLQRNWSLAALFLFVVFVPLVFAPLPESILLPPYGIARWYLAMAVYLAFYLCLGSSLATKKS